jgi:lysyl-tRNA synthetase class 2
MATLKELREERLRKINELKKLGINPYPARTAVKASIDMLKQSFESTSEEKQVVTAGRIIGIRQHGQIAFLTIKDASGDIQLFLRADGLKDADRSESQLNFDDLRLLDLGDFVEAGGRIMRSRSGEITIDCSNLRLLSKALRPMPTAWDGLKDKEIRLRRRYVDLNVNEEVRQRFIRRSRFWQSNRDFLNRHKFIEINIPVLEHTTGGADAKPFKTHMDVLDTDFYLRISHELPLKKLIGGGYEKVYDIGPRFRNEHYTEEHLPEHVALEWYWAYADWRSGMGLMTNMLQHVMQETFGKLQFKIGDFDVDLNKEWEEWDYCDVIKRHYGIDPLDCSLEDVKKALADNNLVVEKVENKARGIDKLWKNIRKTVQGPIWLVNTPLFISPLAKSNPSRPETVERFQPVIAGSELGNGWSELNDPQDQLNRFLEQQKMRDAGDNEAQMLDIDYVEMLEYGMPPTCGWGHSERLFWLFEGVSAREGVPFPQLRPEIDEVTRGIYSDIDFH